MMNSISVELLKKFSKLQDTSTVASVVASLIALATAFRYAPGRKLLSLEGGNSTCSSNHSCTSRAPNLAIRTTSGSAAQNHIFSTLPVNEAPLPLHLPPPEARKTVSITMKERKSIGVLIRKLLFLLRCAIPHAGRKELGLGGSFFVLMLAKIAFTLQVGQMIGTLASCATQGNTSTLLRVIWSQFFLTCLPFSLVTSAFSHVKELIELSIRENLSSYLVHRYLKRKVFFRIAALNAIDNVQIRLTTGVQKWSAVLVQVIHSFLVSAVEVLVYSCVLWKKTGWRGPVATWLFYGILTVLYSYWFSPPIESLARKRLEKRGAFHIFHQNIQAFSEEISCTNASTAVEGITKKLFQRITDHSRIASYLHCRFQLGNVALSRYGSSLLSIFVGSFAVQLEDSCGSSSRQLSTSSSSIHGVSSTQDPLLSSWKANRIKTFSRTTYNFASLSAAFNKMVINTRVFQSLTAYTVELYDIVTALNDADELAEVQSPTKMPATSSISSSFGSSTLKSPSSPISNVMDGTVCRSEHIEFYNVSVVLPSGRCLYESLSFHVYPGMNLLITGPNGCGKSSVLRLLGELWSIQRGVILKPSAGDIYFVSQRPYIFRGSLLEHIIYPDRQDDFSGETDKLYELLLMVGLGNLVPRECDFSDVLRSDIRGTLSTGEEQRLSFARLFYHKPRYAVLDESSSAMDLEIEAMVYQQCHRFGISLITVAHRRSVWKYHDWILYFDGKGGYLFSPFVVNEEEEIIELSKGNLAGSTSTMAHGAIRFSFDEFTRAIL